MNPWKGGQGEDSAINQKKLRKVLNGHDEEQMKRVSGSRLNLQNLCYDNRIYILSLIPVSQYRRQISDGLCMTVVFCYRYSSTNEDVVFRGVMNLPDTSEELKLRYNPSFLMKMLYGYFSQDRMRRIYFVEWRLSFQFSFPYNLGNVFKINLSRILPYRCKMLYFSVKKNHVENEVGFDFSGVKNLKWLITKKRTVVDCESIINDIMKRKIHVESTSLIPTKSISVSQFSSLLRHCKFVNISGEGSMDFSNPSEMVDSSNPRCKTLRLCGSSLKRNREGIGYKISNHEVPHNFFFNFRNLRRLFLTNLDFDNCLCRNKFFKDLRANAPRLFSLYVRDLEVKNRLGEEEDNIMNIILRDNDHLQLFLYGIDSFVSENLHLIDFTNNVLETIGFIEFRGDIEYRINNELFYLIFERFTALKDLQFRFASSDQTLLDGLPNILRNVPETMIKLDLHFPRLNLEDELVESVRFCCNSKNVVTLRLTFANLVPLVGEFLCFPKLRALDLNFRKAFNGRGFPLTRRFILKKTHLRSICENLKNLHTISIGFRNSHSCEALVYFLKYSKHTQHIRFANTFNKPTNYQHFRILKSDGRKAYHGDHLYYSEFERGSDYFEESIDPYVEFKNFVTRRKEEENLSTEFTSGVLASMTDEDSEEYRIGARMKMILERTLESIPPNEFPSDDFKKMCLEGFDFVSVTHIRFGNYLDQTYLESVVNIRFNEQSKIECHRIVLYFGYDKSNIGLMFDDFLLFSRSRRNGVYLYHFASRNLLDYLRFCLSQDIKTNENEREKWISRENFIRLVCSMVGIDVLNGMGLACIDRDSANEDFLTNIVFDMKWIFRESQRIYGVKFEELEDDDVEFIDCMFK